MPKYRICDLIVQSTTPLPELPGVKKKGTECTFQLLAAQSQDSDPCRWFHQWCFPDGEPALLFGRSDGGYLLRFPRLADFHVSRDGNYVRCWPSPDTPLETIRHLFLDQIVPIILSRNGNLVLHGSAVLTPNGVVAFLGETGRGKSTLASSFSEKGAPVLTDDCLMVTEANEQLWVVPSYPSLRLWPEAVDALFGSDRPVAEVAHYSEKKRVDGQLGLSFCSEPAALRRIYVLVPVDHSEGKSVSIVPLSVRDACMELVKFTYLVDVTDRERLRHDFERLSRVAALHLIYRLSFPHDFSLLPTVHRAILENARR